MEKQLATTKINNIYYALIGTLATFFLVNRYLIYAMIVFAGILALIIISNKAYSIYTNKLFYALCLVVGLIIIDLLLHISLKYSTYFSVNVAIKEIFRIIVYLTLIEFLLQGNISLKFYINYWRIILLIVVFIAFLQYTKIFDINEILISVYGDSKQYYNTEYDDFSKFRSGSIFINPNVFSCFLIGLLCCYINLSKEIKEPFLLKILTIALLFFGFLLSGSRTGMLLSIIIVTVYLYINSKHNVLLFCKNLIFLIFGATIIFLLLKWAVDLDFSSLFSSRMFQFEEGLDNSLNIKWELFINLMSKANGLNILFGFGPYDYAANAKLLIDFDIGYFITYFGFLGGLLYSLILLLIWKYGDKNKPQRKNLNIMFVIIMIFFGLTAGIYFNIRIFAIYILMFLPNLVEKNKSLT